MSVGPAQLCCSFGPLTVRYDSSVLEPRGWTLLQSDWAAELAATAAAGPMIELCAGAGHIGLAAAVLSDRDLVQVETSTSAARWAVLNAEIAGWAQRTEIRNATVDDALVDGELFPVMLADPPYLPSAHVRRWPDDPAAAIDGGPDGLDVVRCCLRAAARHLTPDGSLLLQTAGRAQAKVAADTIAGAVGLLMQEVREHDAERAVARFRLARNR